MTELTKESNSKFSKKTNKKVAINSKIHPLITKVGITTGILLITSAGLIFSSYLIFSVLYYPEAKLAKSTQTNYYVDCSIISSGNGSESSPFNSINEAIQKADSGYTIKVKSGDCRNEGRINVTKSNLMLEGMGNVFTKGFTIFNLNNWQSVNNVTVKNFKITETGSDEITGTGIIIAGNSNNISDNHIYQTSRQGIYILGTDYEAKNNSIINNTIEKSGLGFNDMNSIGILVHGYKADSNTIENNIIKENNHAGIGVMDSSKNIISDNIVNNNGGPGIHIGGVVSNNNIIEKNTIYGNCLKRDDIYGIDLLSVGDNNIIRYNIVYSQHDTLLDSNIGPNPGNPEGSPKYGTGGIRFDGGVPNTNVWNASGNKAYYNLIYNERTGMSVLNFNNVEFYNNTIYNSLDSGMNFLAYNDAKTNFSGLVIMNNIIHTAPKMINFTVRPNSIWTNYPIFNNNIYYNSNETKFNWITADVFTVKEVDFTGWKKLPEISANNSESNSQNINPLLNNPTNNNFSLSNNSSAINAGASVGLDHDIAGQQIIGLPDIGAYEYSNCIPATCSAIGKECGSHPDGCGGILDCGNCPESLPPLPPLSQDIDGSCTLEELDNLRCIFFDENRGGPEIWFQKCNGNAWVNMEACPIACDEGICIEPKAKQECIDGTCSQKICTPSTCTLIGKNCGNYPNGCGGVLNCGTCPSNQECIDGICKEKICDNSSCCKAKDSKYPYYNSWRKRCCSSSFIFSRCINP